MDKAIALFERTVQNQMDMIVHQAKRQNNDRVLPNQQINPVHRIDEVCPVTKQHLGLGAVGGEVPAIADGMVLTFYDGEADAQISKNDFHSFRFFNPGSRPLTRLLQSARRHRIGRSLYKNGDNEPVIQVFLYNIFIGQSILSHFRTVCREKGRFGALFQIG